MRIGVGALVGIVGGPATYARELVAALARLGGHDYVVFTDRPALFAAVDVERVHVPLATTYHQVTWDHARLPGLVAAHGVALYHGTKNVLPWRLGVPGVVTVHDLAVYTCPETFAWPQRLHFRLAVPPSVARAARVIADSEHARQDLVERFGLDPARVPVVPLAMPAAFGTAPPAEAVGDLRAHHGLGERLVACIGTIQPRKRVERVIDAFVRARAAERGWELAIAGRLRPGYAPAWLRALPPGVRWLGPLDDDALRALYAAAEIVMTASEYEASADGARSNGERLRGDRAGGDLDPGGGGRRGAPGAALRCGAARRRARDAARRSRGSCGAGGARPAAGGRIHLGGDRARDAARVRGGPRVSAGSSP